MDIMHERQFSKYNSRTKQAKLHTSIVSVIFLFTLHLKEGGCYMISPVSCYLVNLTPIMCMLINYSLKMHVTDTIQ